MTYTQVSQVLDGIGLPYAYDHFEEGNAAPPPFICFYYGESDDLAADNTNYAKIRPLTVELYTDNKDFALEAQVEAAMNAAGLVYSRDEGYIDSERMYEVTYQTEIIISEE